MAEGKGRSYGFSAEVQRKVKVIFYIVTYYRSGICFHCFVTVDSNSIRSARKLTSSRCTVQKNEVRC